MLLALAALALAGTAGDADLDAALHAFRSPDEVRRLAAARRILSAHPDDLDRLVARLERPRAATPARWRGPLRAIGAELPSAGGAPRPAAPEIDWLAKLAALRWEDGEALAEALEAVALVRAIAGTRRVDAVAPLLRFAWSHEGVFRDECGRQIRAMGAIAVPGLVRAQGLAGRESYRLRRYALYQLERMDRVNPRNALAEPDVAIKAEVLRAYGEVRFDAAVEAVIGEIGSASRRVREAARAALRRYVEGPAPAEVKRRLKLPGGQETDEEVALYLTYRQRAELELGKRLLGEASVMAEPGTPAAELARRLAAFHDERRRARHAVDVRRGDEALAAGRVHEAVGLYDWVLAQDPFYAERARMAPGYAAWAEALARERRWGEAAGAWRKALWIGAAVGLRARAEAGAAYADAMAAGGRGHDARALLVRALAADPRHEGARRALARLDRARRGARLRAWGAAAAGAAALGLLLAAGWRRLGRAGPASEGTAISRKRKR